jgi:hypothetical protein
MKRARFVPRSLASSKVQAHFLLSFLLPASRISGSDLQLRRMLRASFESSCRQAAVLLASHSARVGQQAAAHTVYQRSLPSIRHGNSLLCA